MEVINEQELLLSNYEVNELLKEEEQRKKLQPQNHSSQKQTSPLYTIQFEVRNYLSALPIIHQTAPQIQKLLSELKNYKLTKAEKLQILNLRPSSRVEMHLVCFLFLKKKNN